MCVCVEFACNHCLLSFSAWGDSMRVFKFDLCITCQALNYVRGSHSTSTLIINI